MTLILEYQQSMHQNFVKNVGVAYKTSKEDTPSLLFRSVWGSVLVLHKRLCTSPMIIGDRFVLLVVLVVFILIIRNHKIILWIEHIVFIIINWSNITIPHIAGKLVLKHFVPHFPPNFGGVAYWVAELITAPCLDIRNFSSKNNNKNNIYTNISSVQS